MQLKVTLRKVTELTIGLTAMASLILAGCGGGGGGGESAAAPSSITGVVYPVVSGLQYQTDSARGVVSSSGSYSYYADEGVTFSVGGVVLGTTPASAQVTPLNLANDVSATNLLRILLALDTDNNLSNGTSLPTVATASAPYTLDLSVESSVVAALASILPTATLPASDNAQVTSTLASSKTLALSNLGSYGSQYSAIQTSWCTNATDPKSAVVDFTSQPDWEAGTIAGTATLTLNDNTIISVPFTTSAAQYLVGTTNYSLFLRPSYKAKSRIVFLDVASALLATTSPEGVCSLALRDTSPLNPNISPYVYVDETSGRGCTITTPSTWSGSLAQGNLAIASTAELTCSMTIGSSSAITEKYGHPYQTGVREAGGSDVDGFVVAWAWESSKGSTGTANTFSETCTTDSTGATNEKVTATLTVTDDEGATGTKTFTICERIGTGVSLTALTGAGCVAPGTPPPPAPTTNLPATSMTYGAECTNGVVGVSQQTVSVSNKPATAADFCSGAGMVTSTNTCTSTCTYSMTTSVGTATFVFPTHSCTFTYQFN